MLQLAERPARTEPGGLPFAHREAYPAYFARLASHRDARAALRRLITHLDADLDGDERLALWQALWRVSQCLSPADRRAVATCLDGRHAAALAPLDRPWNDPALIEHAIAAALAAAEEKGIRGKAITPFLLAYIEQTTGGKSLDTNIELVCNNAWLAAEIAVAYQLL